MWPTKTSATPSSMQRKISISRGRRKNYRPCWDAECEALCQAFLKAPQGEGSNTAASALLSRLMKRRRKRWSEAVNAIDFMHSSRLAWNAINNLIGRTRRSYRRYPISANAIASQLVKNGTYRTNGHEFTRLALKEVSELWRYQPLLTKASPVTSPRKNLPGPFKC